MDTKTKVPSKSVMNRSTNFIFPSPTSQQIIERQMISYMNIFKNIADQISDLNETINGDLEAAE